MRLTYSARYSSIRPGKRPLTIFLLSLLVLLLLVQPAAGSIFTKDPPPARDGFSKPELSVPGIPSTFQNAYDIKPLHNVSLTPQDRPGYGYDMTWALGDVFVGSGGSTQMWIENTDINDLFVYRFGIEWTDTGESFFSQCGRRVDSGKKVYLGVLGFRSPETPGNHSYRVFVGIVINNNYHESEYGEESWFDVGNTYGSEHYIDVKALGTKAEYTVTRNPTNYYDRVNDILDRKAESVEKEAESLSGLYPGEYNIFQVLSIYDWVYEDIEYVNDPRDDVWSAPEETLSAHQGDCEDHALLLAYMIKHIGGSARVYLIERHAFAAFYIGDTEEQRDGVLAAIEEYYNTELEFAWLEDELGYWLAADPGGALYLGGLPVYTAPVSVVPWSWDFVSTSVVVSIDAAGSVPPPSALEYYSPSIILLILIIAIVSTAYIFSRNLKPKGPECPVCGYPVEEEESLACDCGAVYHLDCSLGRWKCLACGKLFKKKGKFIGENGPDIDLSSGSGMNREDKQKAA